MEPHFTHWSSVLDPDNSELMMFDYISLIDESYIIVSQVLDKSAHSDLYSEWSFDLPEYR